MGGTSIIGHPPGGSATPGNGRADEGALPNRHNTHRLHRFVVLEPNLLYNILEIFYGSQNHNCSQFFAITHKAAC